MQTTEIILRGFNQYFYFFPSVDDFANDTGVAIQNIE